MLVLGGTWLRFEPLSSTVVDRHHESLVVVRLVLRIEDKVICGDHVAELDWRIRVHMILVSHLSRGFLLCLGEVAGLTPRVLRKVG